LWFTGQGEGDWNNCPLQVNIREIKSKKAFGLKKLKGEYADISVGSTEEFQVSSV